MTPQQQIPNRMAPQALYPGDLMNFLWKFKHPRIQTINIERSRWGKQSRDSVGIQDHGTLWVAGRVQRDELKDTRHAKEYPEIAFLRPAMDEEKTWLMPVVCNQIPYATRRDAVFNQDLHRFEGETVRGWRSLFSELATLGVFRYDPELDYMIGERTWNLVPREMRV